MSANGFLQPRNTVNEFEGLDFVARQAMAGMATCTIVQVLAVRGGGIGPVGFVDAQPLINQQDGDGNGVPHGPLHNLPYLRLQGGKSAIIIDPVVGDIGRVVFCSRDISTVKATKAQGNPGSFRTHDMADGIFESGILNGAPTQYLQFTASQAILQAITSIALNAPETNVSGNLTVGSGATGTFTTSDGSTVSVIGGIVVNITNIA